MAGRFDFEVTEPIAVLSSTAAGYSTELNRVSYNGYPAKLDLRKWHDGQPLKGVSLTDEEARTLYAALAEIFDGRGIDGTQKPDRDK